MKGQSNQCVKLKNVTEHKLFFFFKLEPSHNQYKEMQELFMLRNGFTLKKSEITC